MSGPHPIPTAPPAPTVRPELTGLTQVAIPVHDTARATAFYRDVLGLPFLFAAPPNLAFFAIGPVRLMLSPAETDDLAPPGSVLYYGTPDIDASWSALTAHGVEAVGAPHFVARLGNHELWLAFFRDTEGNLLALSSERPIS